MKLLLTTLAVLAAAAGLTRAEDSAPDWVREASTRQLPVYTSEVRSATILDEARATMAPNGVVTTRFRQAIRVLQREGRADAMAEIPYLRSAGKIRDLHAWLISPNGWVKEYGKDAAVDIALRDSYELYNDYRMRAISARNPEPGSTFAWSAELEEPSVVPQSIWYFQQRMPVLLSRFELTVPAGWKVEAAIFNHAPINPRIEGATYTWELRNLDLIKKEPQSPKLHSLAPRLGVTMLPPQEAAGMRCLKSWNDVSTWMSTLTETQVQVSDALGGKARELTAPAQSEADRIRAIGSYVQKIKYVAIEMNLARGGGYQPHRSDDVFTRQYGDCKDKANLMRAMLKAVGIDSYLVTIYSSDRSHVQSNWPSPQQFNHAIIAVKTDDAGATGPVLVHPKLGRLLFFDPTDPYTPVGDLPRNEQGSHAMVIAASDGGLVQVPVSAEEANRTDVEVSATLSPDGSLEAALEQKQRGQEAAAIRSLHANRHEVEFRNQVEDWLSQTAKEIALTNFTVKDAAERSQFDLSIAFKAPSYAQLMQGRLLVFRPSITNRWSDFEVQSGSRTTPVVLDGQCYHKQVRLKLPANFTVDELPDAGALKTDFGKFAASYKVEAGELVYSEELDISTATIPAERYPEVKDFFERVAGAEQAPVVLVKN